MWWDWARWERELDWMALHSINTPLSMLGTEWAWRETFVHDFGLNRSELDDFFPGPAFLPWHWMGNLDGWNAGSPRPLPDGTFTWTTPEDESVPVVDEAPPRADVSAEGKALSRLEGVFPVVVAAIPQIVSVHVVGSSEEDVWRVVRSALPDRSKTCLGREEFVRDVWPALWGAFGERWRSKL